MNPFKDMHYYDILKVPVNADADTIQRAYRQAVELYDTDSLVTYSLFSEEERTELLQSIDEAFHTLIDEDKRSAYNRRLIDAGRIDAGSVAPTEPQPPPPLADQPRPVIHRDLASWVRKKAQEETIRRLIDEVVGKDSISGKDLRQLREAFEVDLREIYEITRISSSTLKMIESDQFDTLPADIFLRAFLKSYAQLFQIDPQRVIGGYLTARASALPAKKTK